MRITFLVPLLAAAWLPAQGPLGWSLRQPYSGSGPAVATHPGNGNPVRFGGFNQSTGHVTDLWEWDGGRWLRHGSREQPPASGALFSSGVTMGTDSQRGLLVLLSATSSLTWTWDGRGWRSLPNSPLMLPRSDAAMAFDSHRGRLVLFGGSTTAVVAETWEWDGSSWTPRAVGVAPSARIGHGLAYDAVRGRTVLFGGRTGVTNGSFGDTWEWDGTSWRQRFPVHAPSARGSMAMAYDPLRQRIVLHGGSAAFPGRYSDTWEWDGSDWSQVTSPNEPAAADSTGFVYSPRTQRLVLFQGVTAAANVGVGESVLEFDGTTWTVPQPTLPTVRKYGVMAADPFRGEVVLFGGQGGGTGNLLLGDTWTWNGDRWQQAMPAQSPAARYNSAISFDAARGNLLLFGGTLPNGTTNAYFDDTWWWNGTTWTPLVTSVRPSARGGHALAYHAPSQRVVLFGGSDSSGLQAGTWLWDGAVWSQAVPTTEPPLRTAARMVGTVQDVVLFGGNGLLSPPNQYTQLDDTWTWNGTAWNQIVTAHRPLARALHAMAYDEDRQQVFVFGGRPGSSQQAGDLWRFDGVDWTAETSADAPLDRYGAHFAYDPQHRELILFGGMRARDQNDTFTLGAASSQATFGAGCAGTLGAPALSIAAVSQPEPGGTVLLDLTGLPQGLGVVAMGFSATTFGGQALPLPLGGYGMPGCDLLVAPEAAVVLVGTGGSATWSLPLPAAAALLRVSFWNQGFAFDPAANAAGLTASNAVRTTIGH